MRNTSKNKRILLIITGSIAAYKTLDLIRRLKEKHVEVTAVLTHSAEQFVTPMSVATLSGNKVYNNLFSLTDEVEIGHIQLSRQNDLVVVAPATADIIAHMALGMASDLATTLLLATDKQVMVAPAMNVRMWEHKAVQRNVALLKQDGVQFIGPDEGEMACGETGFGRMVETEVLLNSILTALGLNT